jgi:alkylation response protein AidB-like acyl-CoA dehydrogenase
MPLLSIRAKGDAGPRCRARHLHGELRCQGRGDVYTRATRAPSPFQGAGVSEGENHVEFHIADEERRLQQRCRCLAEDFATRAARHDREASHPMENYLALRDAGFYALNVPTAFGGGGVGLLGYSLAAEELAQGCPSTALAFNMHLSMVGPLMESPLVALTTKERLARMVVHEQRLIAGNFSEPTTSGLVATAVPLTRARRADGGYRISGRKAFASMLEAADYCAVLAYPDEATSPSAGMLLLVPRRAEGRRVEEVWDTLGMRATRSDSMVLDECWVSEEALLVQSDDIVSFRRNAANWLWASYTAVYLGIAVAAYKAIIETVQGRIPPGFAQSLAYHPDVRRQVAEMSVDLEAARLLTYHSAWLSDTEGPTPATLRAFYRAKYFVGEAVTRITRTAMTLGGAHALLKTSPLERLFRDGAVAPVQFPPRDFCLASLGLLELGLDPREVLPPLKSDRPDAGPVIR